MKNHLSLCSALCLLLVVLPLAGNACLDGVLGSPISAQGPTPKPSTPPPPSISTGVAPEGGEPSAWPHSAWPGPDGFGYTGQEVPIDWVDIGLSGTPVSLEDDDYAGPFPLGFSFRFYRENYSEFYVQSNGLVNFVDEFVAYDNTCPLPGGPHESLIALMWDDLDPGAGGQIRYQGFDPCPTGEGACTVVAFRNVPHYGGSNSGAFEAILYDSGDVLIQFLYGGSEHGAGSTTGIAGANTAANYGLTYACNAPASLGDGLALLLTFPESVSILPEESSRESCPGETVSHGYTVLNYTGQTEPFTIAYLDNTWPVSGPGQIGPIPDGGSAALTITVDIPMQIAPGTCDQVTVALVGQSSGYTTTAQAETCVRVGAEWQGRQGAPFGTMDHVYVGYDGYGYLLGGLGSGGAVGIYDPAAGTWSLGASEPTPLIEYPGDGCFGLNAVGEPVVVLLPDTVDAMDTLHRYNIASDSWDTLTVPAPIPGYGIWGHDTVSMLESTGENVCYVTGGASASGGGDFTSLYAYYPDTNSADYLGNYGLHPQGFAFHAAWYVPWVGAAGGICVGGGVDVDGTAIADTQCYDLSSGTFNPANADLGQLPVTLWGAADAWVNKEGDWQLWLVNGADEDFALWPHSLYYSSADRQWHEGPDPLYAVYRVEGATLQNAFYKVAGSLGGFTATNLHEQLSSACPSAYGVVSGRVTDWETGCTQAPCREAFVRVDPMGLEVPVGPGGWYSATLPVAEYALSAHGLHYASSGPYTISVYTDTTSYMDFCLDRPVVEVEPLYLKVISIPDQAVTRSLALRNLGQAPLDYELIERQPVQPSGETIVLGPAFVGFDDLIEQDLGSSIDGRADVLIAFEGMVDLSPATGMGWDARGRWVYDTLKARADAAQAGAREWLEFRGIAYRSFIADNTMFARLSREEMAGLATLPTVVGLRGNHVYTLDPLVGDDSGVNAPEGELAWGIERVQADLVWEQFDVRGEGIVVANIDSGVEWDHEALVGQFRCPGDPSDPACWEDPAGVCGGSACDNVGHGTHVMGTMVALDDPSLPWMAGMAPGAQWIACKGCEASACSSLALSACADWILAPDGDPANRPHVVNNSWYGPGCDTWYLNKVAAWRAAGIFSVFASGNPGSGCGWVGSPGDNPEAFAVGAVNQGDTIASFSGRGPSCWSHLGEIKPEVTAPGVMICSTVPGNDWSCVESGTSMASPHAAGLTALLWSANPGLVGDIAATEYLITSTATCVEDLSCGGEPCPGGNYTYGHGVIDAYAAMRASPISDLHWVWADPVSGTVPAQGQSLVDIAFTCTLSDAGRLLSGTLRLGHDDPCTGSVQIDLLLICLAECDPVQVLEVYTQSGGCVVSFTTALTGTLPHDYAWDWGPFGGSVAPAPVVDFVFSAVHPYTLTVGNPCGEDVITGTVAVSCPGVPPVNVDFDWQPFWPAPGQEVRFEGAALGAPPITLTWAFGDGGGISGPARVVSHTYGLLGSYTAWLTASNPYGGRAVSHTLTLPWKVYLPLGVRWYR